MGVLRKKIYRSFKNYPRYRKMSLYVEYCILDAQNEQYYTQWIENDIILKWMEIASRIQICKKLWIQNAPQFWGLLVSLFCGFGFYLQFPLIFQFQFMLKVPNIEIHGAFWAFFGRFRFYSRPNLCSTSPSTNFVTCGPSPTKLHTYLF